MSRQGKCGRGFEMMQKKKKTPLAKCKCLPSCSMGIRLKHFFFFLNLIFHSWCVCVLLQDLLHRALQTVSTGLI